MSLQRTRSQVPRALRALKKVSRQTVLGSRIARLCALVVGAVVAALLRPGLGFTGPSQPQLSRQQSFGVDRHSHRHGAAAAAVTTSARGGSADGPGLNVQKKYFNDSTRNIVFIVAIGGTVAGSWIFTGKWWKLPLLFALPSMLYRLWTTRGDTTKLAEVSASVDMKYVASSEQEQKELHSFMCSGCGYTLFPARGREAAFFTDTFKCPMCGAPKEDFFDMNEDEDASPAASSPAATSTGAAGDNPGQAGADKPGKTAA
mmetsp:Transcript_137483/g.342976  ORF Transcript_137483/g.342976 Transcript_137483/m.342976 type:complete len:259 (+) Transcript_137483:71-847(+)|eukprot:CAMPEP_0115649294 /NCGR_PEP_ID=MMETSP0272-20121206/40420_1 /TAXON_ID=71861 /ORGANISM="Scrippsiella trochoidea, Strain CCMP3099" /LENGTH=258 /DNA_ID=CAMNT_0003086945 /DNA_START=71 /DNA_END=847 /DNA_ORIENTATION=-